MKTRFLLWGMMALWLLPGHLHAQTLQAYWQFDAASLPDDASVNGFDLTTVTPLLPGLQGGPVGSFLQTITTSDVQLFGQPHNDLLALTAGDFSVEFLVRLNQTVYGNYLFYWQNRLSLAFFPEYMEVMHWDDNGVPHRVAVVCNGLDRMDANYYTDQDWHHFAITFEQGTPVNELNVYVDGVLMPQFSTTTTYPLNSNAGVGAGQVPWLSLLHIALYPTSDIDYDEIAVHSGALTDVQVVNHYTDFLNGDHYGVSTNATVPLTPNFVIGTLDPLEFPIGYPLGGYPPPVNAQSPNGMAFPDQLKTEFPGPRYMPGAVMPRNFPSPGDLNLLGTPQDNVDIFTELANNFNYYLHLGSITFEVPPNLNNPLSYQSMICNYALGHKKLPTSVISNINRISPLDAFQNSFTPANACGIAPTSQAFVWRDDLPDNFYWQNSNLDFLNVNHDTECSTLLPTTIPWQKELSPLAPQGCFGWDGAAVRYYSSLLSAAIGNSRINYAGENGEEAFSHIGDHLIPCVGLEPNVSQAWINNGNPSLRAWHSDMKRQFREVYRDEFVGPTRLVDNFVVYDVAGARPWNYQGMQNINLPHTQTNQRYATPQFYPQFPNIWNIPYGTFTGIGHNIRGRFEEINNSTNFYAPYVSPGIEDGTANFFSSDFEMLRPGQYLGILKAQVMLGAEYFHVFQYNVSSQVTGHAHRSEWHGWQFVTPSYAQAIASYHHEMYQNSSLMNGDFNTHTAASDIDVFRYRFWAGGANNLVLAREGNGGFAGQYLISGSVQNHTSGNFIETQVLNEDVSINLIANTLPLQFNITKQGSTYFYEPNDPNHPVPGSPLFYQVDAWHEYSHPMRWTDAFFFEAEMFTSQFPPVSNQLYVRRTENATGQPVTDNDFRNSTTYLTFDTPNTVCWSGTDDVPHINYEFLVRNLTTQSTFTVAVRARTKGHATGFVNALNQQFDNSNVVSCITSTNWEWYTFKVNAGGLSIINLTRTGVATLSILPFNSDLEIDQVVMIPGTGPGPFTIPGVETQIAFNQSSCTLPAYTINVVLTNPCVASGAVNFSATGGPVGNCPQMTWHFGDNNGTNGGANGPTATHYYAVAGTYTVTLTVQVYPGAYVTTTTTVTVGNPIVNLGPDIDNCPGTPFTLTTAFNSDYTYSWCRLNNNGTSCATTLPGNSNSITLTVGNSPLVKRFRVTATTSSGCVAFDNINVTRVCWNKDAGEVEANEAEGSMSPEIFPNPTSGECVISLGSSPLEPYRFTIQNSLGEIVLERSGLMDQMHVLDLRELPNGVYFLLIEVDGKRFQEKIVRQ